MYKIFLFIIFLSACGKHNSTSYGFTEEKNIKSGEKPKTKLEELKIAIQTSNVEDFDRILLEEINLNDQLLDGKTPLILSIIVGNNYFAYRLIVDKKVDIQVPDSQNKKAIDYAVEYERKRILILLDTTKITEYQSEMYQYVISEDVEKLYDLLKNGIDPNFIINGESPLTLSIINKSTSIFKTLVRWRDEELKISATNINFPNSQGVKPLKLAKDLNNKNFVKILKDLGAEE